MKKKLFLIVFLFCGFLFYKSFGKKNKIEKVQESYAKLIKNHPFNNALNFTKEERVAFGIPPNKYFEEKYLLEINPYTGKTHPENIYNLQQELKLKRAYEQRAPGDAINNQWQERGPNNVGGRTRMLLFDPNDVNNKRVFAGGVSGGLWVNNDITDENSSWISVGIDENLSVTCMAVDPNNSQIMYIGTGELYVPQQALGNGIWKSIDGGATWTNIYKVRGTTSSGYVPGTYYITDIIVRDADGDSLTTNDSEVFASIGATFYTTNPINTYVGLNEYGLYKSSDEGENWSKISLDVDGNSVAGNDFEISLDNKLWLGTVSNLYGKGGGRVYNSSDGNTFTLKHTIANARRTEISVSKKNANALYVLARVRTYDEDNNLIAPFVSLLKTDDAFGTLPTLLTLPNDADTDIPANDFARGQAYYNLMLEIDPTDDDIAYVGGIDLFRTTNSGTSWDQISKWSENNNLAALNVSYVHADQHAMAFYPSDANVAIFGNDGGVFYTSSLSTANSSTTAIKSRNKDYNIVQFYSSAIGQSIDSEYILGGSQDNGTQFFNNPSEGINSSIKISGGDGARCFVDKDNSYLIVTNSYNKISRFNLPYIGNEFVISSSESSSSFLNAMALDENLDILYSNGADHLSRFSDITTNTPIRTNITNALLNNITALKVSPFTTTSSSVFAGTRTGKLVKIENANTATQTITDISSGSFLGSISSIEFGVSENEIMVTFYNFGVESIWFTDDGGVNWMNKEGDFPDINVRSILMNPLNNDEVIVGTELGVWNTSNFKDASPVWNQSYNGMSNVAVTSLSLRTVDNTILASTFGRGMFTGKFTGNPLTIWTGIIDSDWTNAGNWSNGLPAINMDVKIPNTTIKPILNSAVIVDNIAIETGALLTLNAQAALTVNESLTNNGTLKINSNSTNSGSLIIDENAIGNVTYNRSVTANWHLVSSPVKGQIYNDAWILDNSIISSSSNANRKGLGVYDNSDGWQYFLAGNSSTFNQGEGFTILRSEAGNLSFTGSLLTINKNVTISDGSNNAYNLLGNVFTSYIPINADADASNNFLTVNSSSLSEQTLWLWNGTSYITVNHASSSQFLSPGQAFFVASKIGNNTVSFTKEMQSHQTTNFLKTKEQKSEITLTVSLEKENRTTKIFYIDGASTDFDNGYDSSIYNETSNNLEIYTKLINQKDKRNLAIQSLPKEYSNIIPVGVVLPANSRVEFSISSKNIAEDVNIYLEDKKLGIFTLLENEGGSYIFTSKEKINNSDRFYLHTLKETLHVIDEDLSRIKIYTSNKKVYFSGLPKGENVVEIYNLIGKKIIQKSIEKSEDYISIEKIVKGLYIVDLKTEKGTKSKKIIIQ
ncbi:Por secretion system C-terminal sorting domain-containing protein [Polaribacter sp. KT25b]|uniref:T9SS type A sorting domain-containing protein n=1 Tax=Polaribacter sp. KT25b TaxID=1855336 RepID=UPI00087B47CA|nr:T9SS type A sorting domain-containing protein [Polaribacter sp. KT25b]SDS45466.1 Por secretion system C-terminal sorting domain-containing protein [Polaribacter sp. KT25b]